MNTTKIMIVAICIMAFPSCKEDPIPPVLTTKDVSEITISSALSGGQITSDGGAAIIAQGICWSSNINPTIADNKTVESIELSSFSSTLTDLSPKTQYYVRAYATNEAGTGYGTILSFTTAGDQPGATATNATNTQINSSTINGSVNPFSLPTTVIFEWGTTSDYGNTAAAPQSPVTGTLPVSLSADLTGLTPGTTYHFRIKAENVLGITYSNEITFKTLGEIPTVQINDASEIDVSSAILNGSVNPNHLQTTVTFEWGTSSSYGNTVSALQSPVTGNTPVNISASLTDLSPGTTYHYRIKAENSLGVTLSEDKTFKTLGDLPSAELKPAMNLQYNTATINGRVNPNHLSSSVVFEWGETTLYGNSAPVSMSPITGNQFVDISADITGLIQGTTYHFRIRAENELGTTYSNDLTFTTLAPITDYEGNTYNIRSFGDQVWMTENLKSSVYPDGTSIAFGLYNPGNNISNVEKRGYLYSWSAAIKQPQIYDTIMLDVSGQRVQGVCPTNWHLPTVEEWTALIDLYGGIAVAGLKLKIANPGYWSEPVEIEEPLSGFNAIPAGMRHADGWYNSELDHAMYWTTTQHFMGGAIMGRNIDIRSFYPNVTTNYTNTNNVPGSFGLSVRCIRD